VNERALQLIDRIYEAAVRPEVWGDVAAGVSDLFGSSPVMLGFMLPGSGEFARRFSVHLCEDYLQSYLEYLMEDLAWSTRFLYRFIDRWGEMGELLPDVKLEETSLYTHWLKPQGLAPIWPAGHTIASEGGEPLGGFTVFRVAGDGPFTTEEFAEADALIPHFRRALNVNLTLHGAQRVQLAIADAMDRLPTGIVLLDRRRRVVIQNRRAERILQLEDGFRVDRNGPGAEDAREHATLQQIIADAMEAVKGREFEASGFATISRPSGRRPFVVMVTPLLSAPGGGTVSDAVLAVFVSDADDAGIADAGVLQKLYSLTHSEAELVRLLTQGFTLEDAAETRGVSMNTARSHLKHVFAKTETSRQGELLRLVIGGVGAIRHEWLHE
jgi:DNA-binding CsgD family transcriptional regulator/PAS domain-containing protein